MKADSVTLEIRADASHAMREIRRVRRTLLRYRLWPMLTGAALTLVGFVVGRFT